jgi:hypothetical protein
VQTRCGLIEDVKHAFAGPAQEVGGDFFQIIPLEGGSTLVILGDVSGKGLKADIEGFKEMINRMKKAYPNASTYATTLREVVDTNHHLWGAIMAAGDDWFVVEPRDITVLDRIGGGDGFVGGMLYAILKGWEPEKWIQFGWASGALATTMLTDYAQPADEDQICFLISGAEDDIRARFVQTAALAVADVGADAFERVAFHPVGHIEERRGLDDGQQWDNRRRNGRGNRGMLRLRSI